MTFRCLPSAGSFFTTFSASTAVEAVYGAVTTGTAWKFLRLRGAEVTIDLIEYHIESLGKILGVLGHIVETA